MLLKKKTENSFQRTQSDFPGMGGRILEGAKDPPKSVLNISPYDLGDSSTSSIPKLRARNKLPLGCFRRYLGSFLV